MRNPNFWLRLCAMGDLGFSEAVDLGAVAIGSKERARVKWRSGWVVVVGVGNIGRKGKVRGGHLGEMVAARPGGRLLIGTRATRLT